MAGSWLGTLVEFMYQKPTAIATTASCRVPVYPFRLQDAPQQQQGDGEHHQQQQAVGGVLVPEAQGLGETEEQRPAGGSDRVPVAEDHGGQPDVALPLGLALLVQPGQLDRQEAAPEPGQEAADHHAVVLVLVDVDAERVGRVRVLAAAS